MPIFDHSLPKTSNKEHDRNPVQYLNVLHHNRTQKQLRYFFLNILQKYYQLPILGVLNMPGHFLQKRQCQLNLYKDWFLSACKKWTSFLTSSWRYLKLLQTFYLEYFENASSCPSIMIESPCRKFWWPKCWNQFVGNLMFIHMQKINSISKFFFEIF